MTAQGSVSEYILIKNAYYICNITDVIGALYVLL